MGRHLRRFLRPLPAGLLVFALLGATASIAYVRIRDTEADTEAKVPAAAPSPVFLPSDDPDLPTPSPSPSESPTPKPTPKPRPKPVPVTRASIAAFRDLGTWVDIYDYSIDPEASARAMRGYGVRTLYIQTGRFNLPGDFKDEALLARWVDAAHGNGMKVVGWYLPGYGNMDRDVRRTVAIADFRTPSGARIDALAIDIEDKCEVDSPTPCKSAPHKPGMTQSDWNVAVLRHAALVRAAVGRTYPMAAVPPPPLGMALRPSHWTGFPWQGLSRSFNVVMPMIYWSFREDCASNAKHCAYAYTKDNVAEVRRLVSLPVHAIGGVGDATDAAEVSEYVRACLDAGVIGGSLYDYTTTTSGMWVPLRRLNEL